MDKVAMGARYLLGLIYLVFGLNGFLQFIPLPPPTAEGGAFLGALFATGYMFPIIKLTEIIGGALLLSGFGFGFALILLAPVTVNIFLYHAMLDPAGLALPIVIVLLHALLGYFHFNRFKPLFNKI